nr:unnamed protein product [Callosobruchus analis]
MNTSFTKLGHEECEKYKKARKMYEKSVDEATIEQYNQSGTVVYSMDLQKVMMLSYMEQFKDVVFTKRIVVFNESFVPVGKKQKLQTIACLWHEGISGRKKEDIASSFQIFLDFNRDAKKIIIWLDSCASQNKNWALFSYLVGVVNSSDIEADSIELDYLEPGHTFMSADYFHHQVTQQVKLNGKLYDFADFEECMQRSCSGQVIVRLCNRWFFFYLSIFPLITKSSKDPPTISE